MISVIIPAYNSGKTINKTIESVLKQTFTNFELIVINDGSQDSTLEIVSQLKDPRVKVFSYSNAGAPVSRNRGLSLAVGDMVSFLDADDIWTPDKLTSQWQALQENPTAKVAYSWTDYIDENGDFLRSGCHFTANGNVYQHLLLKNFLENGSNPLIYKEAILQLGGFDESLKAAQDWDMWLRLARHFLFVAVPTVQILYRLSPNSLSCNLGRQETASLLVLEKAFNNSSSLVQEVRSKSLVNLYNYLTCKALQQPYNRRKGLEAARFLWKCIINDSSRLKRFQLTLKLLFKIAIIIILPTNRSTALLTNIKTKNRTLKEF
jgi:glycosyltransferase involved in cell wall biosynthesis